MKLWPFTKKNKAMDNSFELPPGVVLAEFDDSADAAPYIPTQALTGELVDPAPADHQTGSENLDMIMMPSALPKNASVETPSSQDTAKSDLGAFFEQNHLALVSQSRPSGGSATSPPAADVTDMETGSILDVLTPPATQDVAMPVEFSECQASQTDTPATSVPGNQFTGFTETEDLLGTAALFDFGHPPTQPAQPENVLSAPPALPPSDKIQQQTLSASESTAPLSNPEAATALTDWINDSPSEPAADLDPFAATEQDTFENTLDSKAETTYDLSADAELAFWNSASSEETIEQAPAKASEAHYASTFSPPTDIPTHLESGSFYGLGNADTAFQPDDCNSLYLAAPAMELEAGGDIWRSIETDSANFTLATDTEPVTDALLELAPSTHLDDSLDLSKELASALSDDLSFATTEEAEENKAFEQPSLMEEAQASFLAHEPVTETLLSEAGPSDWIGEISESFEDSFDSQFGEALSDTLEAADGFSLDDDGSAPKNASRVTEEGLEVYEPGSDLESYDLGYYTDPEDDGACFDLDSPATKWLPASETPASEETKSESLSQHWSDAELAEALEDSALAILANEATEPVLELGPPTLHAAESFPKLDLPEPQTPEAPQLRLVPHVSPQPASLNLAQTTPSQAYTVMNDTKPACRTVAEALNDFEQSMLLQESRFLKKSIDDLVSRYFAQKESESAR